MDSKKSLLLEEQIYNMRKIVRYDIRELTIQIIVDKYKNGEEYDEDNRNPNEYMQNFIYVPDYQRDFTWDEARQSKLIESVLLGLPIPLIFVAENRDSSWEIVDGSQRIRTLDAFVNKELSLRGLEKLDRANGLRFKDLERSRMGKFLDTTLRIIVLSEDASDEVKKDMFERINRGSDLLKPMEKRKGIYAGPFCDFIYDQCSPLLARSGMAPIDVWLQKRQETEELLLRFFALSYDSNYLKFPSKMGISQFLDRYLDDMNKHLLSLPLAKRSAFLLSLHKDLQNVIEFVIKYSLHGFRRTHNRQTKRVIFEAISVGVLMALRSKPDLSITREKFVNIIQNEEFKNLTSGNVGSKKAYDPIQIKKRINYIKDNLLK